MINYQIATVSPPDAVAVHFVTRTQHCPPPYPPFFVVRCIGGTHNSTTSQFCNTAIPQHHNSTTTPEFSTPSSQLLVPPFGLSAAGLRKSISIDSFTRYNRHTPSSLTIRPARGNTTSSIRPLAPQDPPNDPSSSVPRRDDLSPSTSNASKRVQDKTQPPRPTRTRSRGGSVSTTGDGGNSPLFDVSDFERSDELRLNTVKGKYTARDSIPEGGLSLPSRSSPPGPSASSSATGKAPVPIVPQRGSSLTHRVVKQRSLMSVNTHLSVSAYPRGQLDFRLSDQFLKPSLQHRAEVVLAVVGALGSGKSTVIRKGLKGYGLSDPVLHSIPRSPGGSGDVFKCMSRTFSYKEFTDAISRLLSLWENPSRDKCTRHRASCFGSGHRLPKFISNAAISCMSRGCSTRRCYHNLL